MKKRKRISENEYGQSLDRNGYAQSIMQSDLSKCYRCGRTNDKLDFHEIYGGSNRTKSKKYGLWVALCHSTCHEGRNGVHQNANEGRYLKQLGQKAMMAHYHWTTEEFIKQFGKNYI